MPTASGVRKLLGRLIAQTDGGAALEARMGDRLVAAAHNDAGPAVLYVDNHMRPYTGKAVVRKGWRMQNRRVLPGTSDDYVHDEDGCPVWRVAVPAHDSLTTWLPPLAARLRQALGPDETIVLAFDRAGAYADPLAALRDTGDGVHRDDDRRRERRTPRAASAQPRRRTRADSPSRGPDRGRRQVNFLAHSALPAAQLVAILWNRWRQENGFKHGVERWGIN